MRAAKIRGYNFGFSIHQNPYIVYASSKGSGESAHLKNQSRPGINRAKIGIDQSTPEIQIYLLFSPCLCFISFLYLDLCVLGDDALLGVFHANQIPMCLDPHLNSG